MPHLLIPSTGLVNTWPYFSDVISHRHKHCADAVEATSLDDLVSLARSLLLERQSRKKLGVFVYGNQHRMPSKSTGTVCRSCIDRE